MYPPDLIHSKAVELETETLPVSVGRRVLAIPHLKPKLAVVLGLQKLPIKFGGVQDPPKNYGNFFNP